MIRRIQRKGLQRFLETGSKSGIQAQHADRLRLILVQLSAATKPEDMALPGLVLHPLKGDRKGVWSVQVSGKWRITFDFAGTDADLVDYEDYY
ncbi:MAG: peptidase [Betaproteobacteria bacterium]|nr:peptidase [Betaproteobacteria bacterium]